jgi:hypothetical protein
MNAKAIADLFAVEFDRLGKWSIGLNFSVTGQRQSQTLGVRLKLCDAP